jgi:hypothetical protein
MAGVKIGDCPFLERFTECFSRRGLIRKVVEEKTARMTMRIDRYMPIKKRNARGTLLRAERHSQFHELCRIAPNGRLCIPGPAGLRPNQRHACSSQQLCQSSAPR